MWSSPCSAPLTGCLVQFLFKFIFGPSAVSFESSRSTNLQKWPDEKQSLLSITVAASDLGISTKWLDSPHDKFAVGKMKVNYPSSCCHNPRRLKHYPLAPSHLQLIILGSIGTHAFKCNGAFHFSSSNKNLQRRVFEEAISFSTCMYRCFPTSFRHSSENERSDGWYIYFNWSYVTVESKEFVLENGSFFLNMLVWIEMNPPRFRCMSPCFSWGL